MGRRIRPGLGLLVAAATLMLLAAPALAGEGAELPSGWNTWIGASVQIVLSLAIGGSGWVMSRAMGATDHRIEVIGRRQAELEAKLADTRESFARKQELETMRAESRADLAAVQTTLVRFGERLGGLEQGIAEVKGLLIKIGGSSHG